MAPIPWPTGLPYVPILDSLQVSRIDARKITDMESGPPKMQLKSAMRRQREYRWETDYTRDEAEQFDEYFEDDLCEGIHIFELPEDPLTGDACRMVFVSPPSFAPTGAFDTGDEPRWRASFHVRRMP